MDLIDNRRAPLRNSNFVKPQMRKTIQEWTKQNLWKTVFKKLEVIWSACGRPILNTMLQKIVILNWSISKRF